MSGFSKWSVKIFSIMHPSPINPAANRGNWEELAIGQLKEMNVLDVIMGSNGETKTEKHSDHCMLKSGPVTKLINAKN